MQTDIDRAHERGMRAQRALDDAQFHEAIRYGREAWEAVDRDTENSRSAFEAWIHGSLVESQSWDYLDKRVRAESTAQRSLRRARRIDPKGIWQARSEIRLVETQEWRQDLIHASFGYWRLVAKLEDLDWGQPLALVCCYQMVSCGLKGAPREASELAIAQGKILVPKVETDDIVGSFKRWQAVDLADRAVATVGALNALDEADVLLRESHDLKPIDTNRRMEIGEGFPMAFLEFARENPDAEKVTQSTIKAAQAADLQQYVRGGKMLLSRVQN